MEYTALYRRFRPMTFDTILGQEHITRTLKNQVLANRVGHAYLFTGCRGCGKTTSAKVLARVINCLNPQNGEPCNECSICKAALDGSLTDIIEMDAASNNGVDDIRAIRDEVNFLPTVAKYRVYIIDEVHMLTASAFNALLKTLEEPPTHVKFILATTEPQKLPATILSRCQRFDFKKIPENKIVENLENICKECKIDYTAGALNLIAELSEGAMRDALSVLERCAQDGENKIDEEKIKELVGIPETKYILSIIEKIINKDSTETLKITQEVINSGKDINNVLWEIIKTLRDIMLLKTTNEISNIYNEDDISKIKELIEKIDKEDLLNIIYKLSALENDIKYSSQKNIVFQVGILKLCSNDNLSLEQRIANLENSIKSGHIAIQKANTAKEQDKVQTQPKAKTIEKEIVVEKKSEGANNKAEKKIESKVEAKTDNKYKESDSWKNVINNLKEQKMPMLYSNLINAKGTIIDDMTFGIIFPNGLNSFGKSVIEKPENMTELKRLISIECKKDMRIKLIDATKEEINKKSEENAQSINSNQLDLGIEINIID